MPHRGTASRPIPPSVAQHASVWGETFIHAHTKEDAGSLAGLSPITTKRSLIVQRLFLSVLLE